MNKADLKLTAKARAQIQREVTALHEILDALAPLDFNERRRILRWVCDRYLIDPAKITVGT